MSTPRPGNGFTPTQGRGDQSHYAEATLPRQFDAWTWFDRTRAVTPLGSQHPGPGMPDTYPTGL